jgi:hypothetical protein
MEEAFTYKYAKYNQIVRYCSSLIKGKVVLYKLMRILHFYLCEVLWVGGLSLWYSNLSLFKINRPRVVSQIQDSKLLLPSME